MTHSTDANDPTRTWDQLVKSLVNAQSERAFYQVLHNHPVALSDAFQQFVSVQIRQAWRLNNLNQTRDYLICRTFLEKYHQSGLENAVAQMSGFPLDTNNPLHRLSQLTAANGSFSDRAHQAWLALLDVCQRREPELWAALHTELGDCLLQSKGMGCSEDIEKALNSYQSALSVYEAFNQGSFILGHTLHNLASTYKERARGNQKENLETAVSLYQQALTIRTKSAHPQKWGETQHSLGIAWADLTSGNRQQNTENAIQCFNNALSVRSRDEQPEMWAMTTHEMGMAFTQRIAGSRIQNIEKAIFLLRAALQVRTKSSNPLWWGESQIALGNAFLRRLKDDRTQNVEQAIQCLKDGVQALKNHLSHCALAHASLGVAYYQRTLDDRVENLNASIKHHRFALEKYSKEEFPTAWARTKSNLGNVYWNLQVELPHQSFIPEAIRCFEDALTIRTPEQDPEGWATVQNNLGNAYADLVGGNKGEYQNKAIACYENALKFRTRENAPARWADTMNNLGAVYIERVAGNPRCNQQKAIDYLSNALKIHQPETFPFEARRAARNLAHLHFTNEQWKDASIRYQQALDASEWLYQAGATRQSRQVELRETRNLGAYAAYSLAKQDNFEDAINVLEANKAREFGKSLDLAKLTKESAQYQNEFEELRSRIVTLEAEAQLSAGEEERPFLTISADLTEAQQALKTLINKIQKTDPDFMPKGLTFNQINSLVNKLNSPLVYLLTTMHGSLALIVVPKSTENGATPPIYPVWLDDFTANGLAMLLNNQGEHPGYLSGIVFSQPASLMNVLTSLWPQLQTGLFNPIAQKLDTLGYKHASLIPVGLLNLLPLPALTIDTLTISLAPSARALQSAWKQSKARVSDKPSFLGIGNPLPNANPLVFACPEVKKAATFFAKEKPLCEQKATKAAIVASFPGISYLHLACHGMFNIKKPLNSMLQFAGDDKLTLREIVAEPLDLENARLCVLSACQTGIIEFEDLPDEAIGFPTGLLQAGIPGIISTLWPVDDVSTALLMGKFYALHRHEKMAPGAALRLAQCWMRDDLCASQVVAYVDEVIAEIRASQPLIFVKLSQFRREFMDRYGACLEKRPFSHPYYWAAFTMTGV